MSKQLLFVLSSFVFIIFSASTQGIDAPNLLTSTEHQFFIKNIGLWPAEVKYLCRNNGMNAWITNQGVVYDHYQIIRDENTTAIQDNLREGKLPVGLVRDRHEEENTRIKGHVVRVLLQRANAQASAIAKGQRDGYYNYFIGNDPANWASFVSLYDEIEVEGVYHGIDIRYYYDRGQLRYDYRLAAGADPSQIQFRLEGADGYQVNAEGELLIETSLGEVRHGKLRAYQQINDQEREVTCGFESLPDGTIGVMALDFDKAKPLIIDPLVYSTFIGGSGVDVSNSITIDNSGNTYITGRTASTNYPTSSGAYDVSQNGNMDVFVTKLDASGSTLIYSTFIGGSGFDNGNSIAVDSNGNAYVTGYTESTAYPTTSGAYDQSTNGTAYDAFVTKLNASGSALVYSTFLGGSSSDYGISIILDSAGNAHIAGETFSSDYPTTSGGYDKTYNGGDDIFITKLNASGSALVYSTYIGGTSYDVVHSLAVDINGYACITGETTSLDYPINSGAYDKTTDGLYNDVFVTKLNYGGTALIFSTFLGGSSHDCGTAVAFDNNRNVYVTGYTYSSNFPTTPGAYSQSYHGNDVFVSKLDAFGAVLVYSTFIGGSGSDATNSLAIDNSGNAYVTGYTISNNYPTTSDAYDRSYNGGDWDVFVTKLNASGSTLDYSTFIGGSSVDFGKSIAIDNSGNAFVTGYTTSSNYPTSSGAFDQSYNGNNSDVFVTKLSLAAPDISSTPIAGSYNSINIGSFLDITFVIRNEGNGDLKVTATTLTGTYATEFSIQSGGGAFTLAPAATRDIVVRFNPTSAGYKATSLSISSNDPDENPFLVLLSGTGTVPSVPDISSYPNSWSFGGIDVGTFKDKFIEIRNDGNADLNVTATTLAGTSAAEFSIHSGGGAFTLAPAAFRNIVIRFHPTSPGDKVASLNISSNDPDENPFVVALSGSGTAVAGIPINPVATTPQMAGIEFWVSIDVGTNANPVTDLFGISFNLNYTNTNYINYSTSEAGSFIGADVIFFPTPDDPNGKVSIGISRKAPQAGVNGFGTVARVKLIAEAATPNNTPIQLSISNLAANNATGAAIALMPGSLTITIQSGLIVWPGDTNNNGLVDQADILPLGLQWGKTGPARQNASMAWSGQLAMFWNPQAATYADANGDGTVNQADVLPIGLNWNKTHTSALAKPGVGVAQANKSTATNLTITITGDTNPDKDFFIDILVNNVTNLFGLSFELIYTPIAFVNPLTAEPGIDNLMGTDLIYFPMINKNAGIDTGKVAVGISSKSGQGGVTGTGLVTRITAHMAATALSGASATRLSLQNIVANDPSGNPIAIDTCFFKLVTGSAVANVSGAVRHYQNSSPIDNATITIDGHTTTTGTDGSFSFNSIPGGNLTLTPSKTGDLGSSISAYDASIVLRYSVGLITLTPYQLIAGDVSGNGSISAYDASFILRYTVGLISSFPVGADWKFVPNSYAINTSNWNTAPGSITYSPLNSDQTNQDFTGIVYGDVSGNWSQLNLAKNFTGSTTVKFGDVVRVSSNEFIVPIETNVSGQMFSAKIEVQFEDDVINFQEVLLSEKLKDYAECHNVQAGHLTIALAGTGDIELEKDFISIKFIARNAEEKQPGTLKIVDAMVNEGQIAVDFRNGNISLNHTLPSTHQLEQNYPNPFNLSTTIAFQLSQPSKVLLAIYDLQGHEIRILIHELKAAGHYSANWDGRDEAGNWIASGIYFYKLWTNQFSVTKKCLLIK